MARIPTLEQLDLMEDFQVTESQLANKSDPRFGRLRKDGKLLYRFLTKDYRVYFEVQNNHVIVHRVLHKNTFVDFLYRTNLAGEVEDAALEECSPFWQLIDEGIDSAENKLV